MMPPLIFRRRLVSLSPAAIVSRAAAADSAQLRCIAHFDITPPSADFRRAAGSCLLPPDCAFAAAVFALPLLYAAELSRHFRRQPFSSRLL